MRKLFIVAFATLATAASLAFVSPAANAAPVTQCAVAPPGAPAGTTVVCTVDGLSSRNFYHYNNPALGGVNMRVWVDVRTTCSPSATPGELACVVDVRGHMRLAKISRAVRLQTELVRLGHVSYGVLAEDYAKINSGTAATVESVTAFRRVRAGCAAPEAPAPLLVRGQGSVRWSDGTLGFMNFLGNRTTAEYCPEPVGTPAT